MGYDQTKSLLVAMFMLMPIVVSEFVLRPASISGVALMSHLSQALAGLILRWSLPRLFALTGVPYGLLISWAAFRPEYEMAGKILATPVADEGRLQPIQLKEACAYQRRP